MSAGDRFVKGSNLFIATFWVALGIGGIVAGASGFGGALTVLVGVGALMYGLYGLYSFL
jgi:hypothetical protein